MRGAWGRGGEGGVKRGKGDLITGLESVNSTPHPSTRYLYIINPGQHLAQRGGEREGHTSLKQLKLHKGFKTIGWIMDASRK